MSRYDFDNEPYVVIEKHEDAGVAPFLVGLAIGAGVALLYAPRSGRATRRDIKRRAMRVRDAAEQTVTDVRDSVVDQFEEARRRVEDQIESARTSRSISRSASSAARSTPAGQPPKRPSSSSSRRSRRRRHRTGQTPKRRDDRGATAPSPRRAFRSVRSSSAWDGRFATMRSGPGTTAARTTSCSSPAGSRSI